MENVLLKKKIFLYISEFISGIAVMGIEIAANRLLAPYLSSSQVVLTIITGMVLIAMSIGNIIGGKLSDKFKSVKYLYVCMLIAGAYVIIVPFIGKYVIGGIAILFALFVNSGLIIYTTVISCLILIVPPLLLLGMVTPSLIKYTMGNVSSGKIIGWLEALNTIGSIIGTFLPTFLTIPYIGTLYTFIIFGSLLVALGLIFIITDIVIKTKNRPKVEKEPRDRKLTRKRIFRLVQEMAACIIAVVIVTITLVFGKNHTTSITQDDSQIYEGESMYNYLKVEETNSAYYFSTNIFFGTQSMLRKNYSLTGMYYDSAMAAPYMANLYRKEKLKILILGNGTGTYATMLKKHVPYELDITGIEIDQKIIDLSYEYFQMPDDIKVYADDGRSYLSRDKEKYDVIMVDAYSSISAPFQMTTVEFFNLVKNHLVEDGVMVMNINMILDKKDSINQSLCDTTYSVFNNTYSYRVPANTNMVVFASNNANFVNNFKDNLEDLNEKIFKDVFKDVANNIQEHEDTGIRLYDTSADVEVKSLNAVDGIIMEELEFYRQVYKDKGLKGILDTL